MRAPASLVTSLAIAFAAAACGKTPEHASTQESGRCATCHMPEYTSARHHVGVKPNTCAACHAQTGWHPTALKHTWPLTGAHEKAKCFACHVGEEPAFEGTKKECLACHQKEHERAPSHERFPTTCETCHSTSSWKELLPTFVRHPDPEPPPPVVEDAGPAASVEPSAKPPPKPKPTWRPPPTPTANPTTTTTATTTPTTKPTTKPPPDVTTRPSPRE